MAARRGSGGTASTSRKKVKRPSFLVDVGYDEGRQFCKALLRTEDFPAALLRQFAERGGKSDPIEQVAGAVADAICDGRIDAGEFLLAYCKQPRTWLCVRAGSARGPFPTVGEPSDFFNAFDESTRWFGPLRDKENGDVWYVGTHFVRHFSSTTDDDEGERRVSYAVRWHVVAQVSDDFVALHWNGFTTNTKDENEGTKQFPYWREIPTFFDDLADLINGGWDAEEPNLSTLLLHNAFGAYGQDPQLSWKHKRVRAGHKSVALNASGGTRSRSRVTDGGDDADDDDDSHAEEVITGLRILTSELAKTAAAALGHSDQASIEKVEHRILRMILHHWGTKSYEFILQSRAGSAIDDEDDENEVEDGAEDDEHLRTIGRSNRIARMRIYFGTEHGRARDEATVDSLQHVFCFAKYGGSVGALGFILREWRKAEDDADEAG